MGVGMDLELTGGMSNAVLSPIPARRQYIQPFLPHIDGLEALSHPAGLVWCSKRSALVEQEALPPQEVLWKQFFADRTQWWDNRRNKPTPRHPDFRHKVSKVPLWLNNRRKPQWVDSRLATMDAGLETTPEAGSISGVVGSKSSGGTEGHLEVEKCRKLCEEGPIPDAVDALELLLQRGCHIPHNLCYRVLKRCIRNEDMPFGKRIHALTVTDGYEGDTFLATHLIGFYATHGMLEKAMAVFTTVATPDAYNWASIIFAYARHGVAAEATRALSLYRRMRESTTVQPDDRLFSAVLKACAAAKDLVAGKEVHAHIVARPKKPDKFVQAGLVDMYAKCGSLEDARRLFDELSDRNVVTWNVMITGYAQQGMGQEAVNLYRSLQQEGLIRPNSVTYVCLMQACASIGAGALDEGKQLHEEICKQGLQDDVVLGSSLVNMYAKCGSLKAARSAFDKLPEKNVVTWTVLIAGYTHEGMGKEALSLFRSMQQEGLAPPDSVTYVCLLQACASVGVRAVDEGRQLHAQIKEQGLEQDVIVGGSLVNMYAKCGSLEEARIAFDHLVDRDVVAWTSLIAGYAQQGMGQEALLVYSKMQEESLTPNAVTFVCLLQACASAGVEALNQGEQLHAQIKELGLENDVVVGGGLVNMYVKCGNLEDARIVFEQLPERNLEAWNAMLAGYAQQGMGEDAINVYSRMQQEGVNPNSVTYVCMLQACAAVAALRVGEQLHAEMEERGMQVDSIIGAALVNMYAKCGSMEDSQRVFDALSDKSIEAWGALVGGYARHGESQVVFDLLGRMKLEGVPPDEITFLFVLTVCSHAGLVDKGREYFEVMRTHYGISATMEHYVCMVDLLGRAGHLEEALQMIKTMPFPPGDVVWDTLLGACRKWKNVEIGQQAFKRAAGVDDADAASYVLMSNLYASTQMWTKAKEMQARS